MKLQPARLSTDLTGEDNFFDGFTTGETWNGFACPYFTFEQGERIVAAANRAAANWLERDPDFNTLHGRYDCEGDAFIFYYRKDVDSQTPEQDWDLFHAEIIEGQKLYPIGSGSWAWTQEEI